VVSPAATGRTGDTASEHTGHAGRIDRTPLGTTVRAVAQTTPTALTLVRRRAQPTAAFIARLTVTSVFAYLLALLLLPVSPQPVLAPLTALLVVQVTMYQTIRNAVQRVASVVAGVLVAVAFSAVVGFTWWSLAILIAVSLAVGHLLRLGNQLLEVPVSAMLILSPDSRSAAAGRIIETAVGAGAGLLGGLILAPVRVQPAEEAIDDMSGALANLLDQMAGDLEAGSAAATAAERLAQARGLGREIQHVDRALTEAEESLRLNPRKWWLPFTAATLRDALETLERATTTVRGVTRSIADEAQLDASAIHDDQARECLASILRQLAAAFRTFGRLVRVDTVAQATRQHLDADLAQRLATAGQDLDRLAGLLRAEPAAGQVAWPLRGELLIHLRRLLDELRAEPWAREWNHGPRRHGGWAHRIRSPRLHLHHPRK
jgi:uncharacterized membrane protein YgaE (UPF0421/DUF939 family)